MRRAFSKVITEIVLKDPSVVIMAGDIGFALFDVIRKERPRQFYNVGVMEQSMVGIAAGMALAGMKPWCFTITPFLIERAFEQIKLDVDANNANIKLIGYCDYPEQGVTHSEMLRFTEHNPFQNIICLYPINSVMTELFVRTAYEDVNPYIISLKKDKECI